MTTEPKQDDKPTFMLLPRPITFEGLMEFFDHLTGRQATPEEEAEARKIWEEGGGDAFFAEGEGHEEA